MLFSLPHPLVFLLCSPCSNAPSGGFGYTGMQSSFQSQFSYGLSQGLRARTPSSDVNEALYNLDRVLQGKSAAYMHERPGCTSLLNSYFSGHMFSSLIYSLKVSPVLLFFSYHTICFLLIYFLIKFMQTLEDNLWCQVFQYAANEKQCCVVHTLKSCSVKEICRAY